ncbi:hypothetical protein FHX37_3415 [Haloactinospora alba]|uniref:PH (Pleckstrin Homology) domain-containing protein n=1 Tax=Haloactinospora alba TaxID=405555 RepID=A0A543NNI9_9ACTN|nr:hypothetical protein [Haloactinospora alba]TQN33400.1 hypothetical protein FHX37_3415 [Haloactinospora alba]
MDSDGYYRIDNEARRGMVRLAWAQFAFGLLQVAAGVARIILVPLAWGGEAASGLSLVPHSAYTLCGLVLCAAGVLNRHLTLHAHTRLRPDGIMVHQLRERLIPWREVTGVRPRLRGRFQTVEVTLASGRSTTLPAPVSPATHPAPGFEPLLNTVHQWWWYYRPASRD